MALADHSLYPCGMVYLPICRETDRREHLFPEPVPSLPCCSDPECMGDPDHLERETARGLYQRDSPGTYDPLPVPHHCALRLFAYHCSYLCAVLFRSQAGVESDR